MRLTSRLVVLSPVFRGFSKDKGQTAEGLISANRRLSTTAGLQLEMPVNVAVEEPWSRVIREPTDSNVITSGTQADDITTGRVVIVVVCLTGGANDIEGMSMKMEWVWTASNTCCNRKLDDFVPLKVEYGAIRHQLIGSELAAEELKQNRQRGRCVSGTVDRKRQAGTDKSEFKVDVNVSIANTGGSRL
jgi:hypothetical protein